MMNITINGKKAVVHKGLTPKDLMEQRKITKGSVWINGNQLLKKEYETTVFQEGDQVKLLRIISGG